MRTRRRVASLLLGVAALAACTATLPTRLYTLERAQLAPPALGTGPALGLGPIELAPYLDRPEIVTRSGVHQVQLGEFDRWAEPLQAMLARQLGERLREAAGSRAVLPIPSRGGTEPRYAVAVSIDRFDADETGKVVLDARWRVYQTSDERTVRSGHEIIEESAATSASDASALPAAVGRPDYPATVAAMDRTLDSLAQRIAAALPGTRTDKH
jgi:uncharacterized lipoprotein YmbA